ncbi:hypothetical protein ACJMK2_019455 [Sinanodonta woodiana]|uniref:Uncharacterized protein n=1 Tax=Sinanodonta woodiana TaxID=1069815 RepID=A0ABD3UI05_SINWO
MELLATEIVPETALQALMGLGLKGANNWSLRAAGRRTTLLLVWDAEENEEKGRLSYRRGRGKKQPRREKRPVADTPSPPPATRVEENPEVPTENLPVQGITLQALHERIEHLSNQILEVFYKETEDVATSPLNQEAEPEPDKQPEPPPPPTPAPTKKGKGKGKKRLVTSTPSPASEVAILPQENLEAASPKAPWASPPPTTPTLSSDDQIRMGWVERLVPELLNDKHKSHNFINAVTYVGFRYLRTTPPRAGQWNYGSRLLAKQYTALFEQVSIEILFGIARILAPMHGAYFPNCISREDRTSFEVVEEEIRRGTFQPERKRR